MIACGDRCSVIEIRCKHCLANYAIMYNRDDMVDWLSGSKSIQDALWYLSADERELLLSSICGKCFNEMFPPLDNDE